MSIELVKEDYCDNCDAFDPIAETYYFDCNGKSNVRILCERRHRCKKIYEQALLDYISGRI